MTALQLSGCPWCQQTPRLDVSHPTSDTTRYRIFCENVRGCAMCPSTGLYGTQQMAVDAWEQRAPPTIDQQTRNQVAIIHAFFGKPA